MKNYNPGELALIFNKKSLPLQKLFAQKEMENKIKIQDLSVGDWVNVSWEIANSDDYTPPKPHWFRQKDTRKTPGQTGSRPLPGHSI